MSTKPTSGKATDVPATPWDPSGFNPHAPAFLADPFPTYALFREHAPFSVVQPYNTTWVFRHADVRTVLDDPATFLKHAPGTSAPGAPPGSGVFGMGANMPTGLFASDPPRHTELRSVLEPLLMTAIESAPQIAAAVAEKLIAGFAGTDQIELVDDYAMPLPSAVLFTILGIPQDHWPVLLQWVQAIVAAHDIAQSITIRMLGATCSLALNEYLSEWVLQCANVPSQPGLIPAMCAAIASGGLTAEDIQMCGNDFIVAGYLSTTFMIGTGMVHLIQNPDQMELLRSRPDLIHNAVEEILRADGPVQVLDRVAVSDTKIGDVAIPAGTKLTLVLGSADHDPAVFPNPDAFDIQRDNTAQLSFGAGIHHCVGAPLARLVAPVAINALLELDDITLAGIPQWQTDPYLRAMTNIPLSFAPG
jgi:cytochrome P450